MLLVRLTDVLVRRDALAPPEVVTLVVGLALDLADLHARGRAHGNVRVETVWFEPGGRPRLSPPVAGADEPAADAAALAALGLRLLGDNAPTSLVDALSAEVTDARDLAERVMASGPAAPLRLSCECRITRQEPGHSTSSKLPVLVAVAALALDAHVPRPAPWREVLAALDQAREAAVAERSVAELRAVYDAGSPQLARDIALVRGLARRGLTLRGHLAELTDPAPLSADTVAAVERPARYVLVDARGHVVLRVDNEVPRRVVVRLRHTDDGWRVVDVS